MRHPCIIFARASFWKTRIVPEVLQPCPTLPKFFRRLRGAVQFEILLRHYTIHGKTRKVCYNLPSSRQSEKVLRYVKGESRAKGGPTEKKFFNFLLASPEVCHVLPRLNSEDAFALTGFAFNGVCPIGMKVPIPLIVSDRIAQLVPQYLWLGGGGCMFIFHS